MTSFFNYPFIIPQIVWRLLLSRILVWLIVLLKCSTNTRPLTSMSLLKNSVENLLKILIPEEALEDELSDLLCEEVYMLCKEQSVEWLLIDTYKNVSFLNIINMFLLKKLLIMIMRKINMAVLLYLQLIFRF